MSKERIKIEIQHILDKLPEDTLPVVLEHLKQFQTQTTTEAELSAHIKKILTEEQELLKRLTQ